MLYTPTKVDVPSSFHEKIKKALQDETKKSVSVKVGLSTEGQDTLLLTRGQIAKLERARIIGKRKTMTIPMSRSQVQKNLKYEGGFLGMLIAALSAAIPSILSAATAAVPAVAASVATGAISGAVSHLVSGDGLFLQKNGMTAKIQAVHGGGLYLAPHPTVVEGDGLLLSHEGKTYGQLENSPWMEQVQEQVPTLKLLK